MKLIYLACPYSGSKGNDWEFWKTYSRELIQRADELHILCLDGWENSTGIKAEILIAVEFGKPIITIREV